MNTQVLILISRCVPGRVCDLKIPPLFFFKTIDIFPYLLSLFLEPVLEPGQVPHPEVPSWARDFAALAELNKAQQPWDVPRGHDMSGETNTLLFRGLYYKAKPFSIMESKRFVFRGSHSWLEKLAYSLATF